MQIGGLSTLGCFDIMFRTEMSYFMAVDEKWHNIWLFYYGIYTMSLQLEHPKRAETPNFA